MKIDDIIDSSEILSCETIQYFNDDEFEDNKNKIIKIILNNDKNYVQIIFSTLNKSSGEISVVLPIDIIESIIAKFNNALGK
jgi:hypothetical protein